MTAGSPVGRLDELVVCSLEPWDDIWRRNQFFVDGLLRRHPGLRVLFVEPAADPLFELSQRRRPVSPRFKAIGTTGRLKAFRPLKLLPRRVPAGADSLLSLQVRTVARAMGLHQPVLWINDLTYAPLIQQADWPALYDVTDDWLLAPASDREVARLSQLEAVALAEAQEVVVCSQALVRSKGRNRSVHLIPNGVDVEHFRRPQPRPLDMSARGPVAVYVGTLHESRLDVDLVEQLAQELPDVEIVLVGPNSLRSGSTSRLAAHGNIRLLGPRPYADVPGYLQHADVIVVPHSVNPFTESLDPIKAYECLAVDTPAVATPIAGFRDLGGAVRIAAAGDFPAAVRVVLDGDGMHRPTNAVSGWAERIGELQEVLLNVAGEQSTQVGKVSDRQEIPRLPFAGEQWCGSRLES